MQDSKGKASTFAEVWQSGGVRGGAVRDVLKVWLYAVISVAAGAWLTPLLYNAGMALGEVTSVKRTNGFFAWLGRLCRDVDFPVYYTAAVIGVALLLFVPFAEWLELKRGGKVKEAGQPLRGNPRGMLQWGTGLLLASGFFLLMGYGLVVTGSFGWNGPPAEPLRLFKFFPWLVLVILFQEWLFRGVALGIFLRAMRPVPAISLAAFLFAAVVFLLPQPGVNVADPDASGVGFELLRKLLGRLADPAVLLGHGLPVVAAGWVLGYARWRTASLWLPVGLQMGWLVAVTLFQGCTKPIVRVDPLAKLIAGDSLMHGFIPLAGLVVLGALVYFFTDPKEERMDERI